MKFIFMALFKPEHPVSHCKEESEGLLRNWHTLKHLRQWLSHSQVIYWYMNEVRKRAVHSTERRGRHMG